MPYKVLYRKYRPQDFNDLYGQESIKKILMDSIINNKIAHAYIFCGPRGTGKTSTAKLFAKTINCENPNNGIPCGKCNACLNYEDSPDIIEIDAASNNGVDEIRELRDNVKILPTFSKYKIYIIDEVHMLSQSAWNAFLKTLEEPPAHVVFILATTEIQKVPITVLSRCQRYSFNKISKEIISENIKRISDKEKIEISDEAADYIAELSDGGMRDALSILDQLSKEETKISLDLIKKTYGYLSMELLNNLFLSLNNGDMDKVLEIFTQIEKQNIDTSILIKKLIDFIYHEEIQIKLGQTSVLAENNEINTAALDLEKCYQKNDSFVLIKMTLINYFFKQFKKNSKEIISREIILGNEPVKNEIKKEDLNHENLIKTQDDPELLNKEFKINQMISIRINNSFVNAEKAYKNEFIKKWQEFIVKTKLNQPELMGIYDDLSVEVVSDKNALFSSESTSNSVLFNNSLSEIEKKFNKFAKSDYKFICLYIEDWNKEKKKYILDKKTKKYNYINEDQINMEHSNETINMAKDLFDTSIIKIN